MAVCTWLDEEDDAMITEKRKMNLIQSILKLEAYQEIQNEMGRAVVASNFRQADALLSHFALERDDVSLEFADEGLFEGPEAVRAIVSETIGVQPLPGEMSDMQLTTPMVEVADDLKTAKAVWWCPGAGAIAKEGAEPEAIWNWGMIAADFICMDGVWKIWHLHFFRFIKCAYDKGWVEDTSMINRANTAMHPLAKPTTYHNPYHPKCIRDGIPACPSPYATYTDRSWMLETDKMK